MDRKYVVLPPMEEEGLARVIPKYALVLLACAIPEGYLITEKALLDCLKKAYNVEVVNVQNHFYQWEVLKLHYSFPFWRVVSERGHLIGAKETQKSMLEKEGFSITEHSVNDQYVVDDYKSHLVDITDFEITVLKRNRELLEQMSGK